jgi:hypothetical protein
VRRSAVLLLTVCAAGCGGGSPAAQAPAPVPTTAPSAAAQPTPAPAVTSTAELPAPTTAAPATTQAPATTSTTTATTTPPSAPRTTDCEALGITRQKLREGPCSNGGVEVHVANTKTTVDLPEMSVRLNGVGLQHAGGSRVYANLSVTVTNRLDKAAAFDALGDQTLLALGNERFTEDVEREAAAGAGIAKPKVALKPGEELTVNLIFALPQRSAKRLATDGALLVTQFTDAGRAHPRKRIAVLRTYH